MEAAISGPGGIGKERGREGGNKITYFSGHFGGICEGMRNRETGVWVGRERIEVAVVAVCSGLSVMREGGRASLRA